MKTKIRNLHFVGIGGAGMSGIAEVLINQGFKVQGSDIEESISTKRLSQLGAKIFIGHSPDNVAGADVCVVSSAIKENNSELKEAKKIKIPIVPRAQMLAELMRFKKGIAVGGSHGKTTTTSLITSILASAGFDPTYVLGGRLCGTSIGAKLGKSEYLVVEADESDGSFLQLSPMMAVITNIDKDHLKFFENNFSKLKEAFISFVHTLPFYGPVIMVIDDPGIKGIVSRISRPLIGIGFSENADIQATQIESKGLTTNFLAKQKNYDDLKIKIPMSGKHNILNSLLAIAVARELNIKNKDISKALLKFKGVERRFQFLGDFITPLGTKFSLIDDYGHHPNEIKATISACREAFYKRRIFLIFQPHRYSRTKDLFNEFASVLSKIDSLVLLDVYSAGEKKIPSADSKSLGRLIRKKGKVKPINCKKSEDVLDVFGSILKQNDVLLIMGAGSISGLSKMITNLCSV